MKNLNKLNIGDVVVSVKSYKDTGLPIGQGFEVVSDGQYNFGEGHYTYKLKGGYILDHKWMVDGHVVKVNELLPAFEIGAIVRIKKSKYASINDFGKRGIIVRKHWGPIGERGREMYGVYVEGDATQDWSYANDELEAI